MNKVILIKILKIIGILLIVGIIGFSSWILLFIGDIDTFGWNFMGGGNSGGGEIGAYIYTFGIIPGLISYWYLGHLLIKKIHNYIGYIIGVIFLFISVFILVYNLITEGIVGNEAFILNVMGQVIYTPIILTISYKFYNFFIKGIDLNFGKFYFYSGLYLILSSILLSLLNTIENELFFILAFLTLFTLGIIYIFLSKKTK